MKVSVRKGINNKDQKRRHQAEHTEAEPTHAIFEKPFLQHHFVLPASNKSRKLSAVAFSLLVHASLHIARGVFIFCTTCSIGEVDGFSIATTLRQIGGGLRWNFQLTFAGIHIAPGFLTPGCGFLTFFCENRDLKIITWLKPLNQSKQATIKTRGGAPQWWAFHCQFESICNKFAHKHLT